VLAVGTPVRRRGSGEVGVVVGGSAMHCRVAFGSTLLMLDIDELELAPQSPSEQLAAGQLGDPELHVLRVQAQYLRHAYRHDPQSSLNNARIEPQLHQVFVAHRVTSKLRPRMILADEVGLGKTIEAGLVIKELRAREQVARVLIVCPASLTRQWQSELATKFNEQFEIIDGTAATFLAKGRTTNPFLTRDNVICSLQFATSRKRVQEVLDGEWDLVVFDEAHRVRRTKQRETQAYRLADELKETANGLLLLTATPVQIDPVELYSLIQLVEPGLFVNEKAFANAQLRIPALNDVMRALNGWDALTAAEQVDVEARFGSLLRQAGCHSVAELEDDARRARVVDAVIALHPMADVMVRNRKAELGLTGRRRAVTESVPLTDLEWGLYEDVTAYLRDGYNRARATKNPAVGFLMVTYQKMLTSSSHALRTSFRNRIAALEKQRATIRKAAILVGEDWDDPQEASEIAEVAASAAIDAANLEVEIAELVTLAGRLDGVRDSKMARAVELCSEILSDPTSKIVVFTQFIETQSFFAKVLDLNGIKAAIFNGRMNADEKERAIREFRERASVLVSTEAGGEGRNLQFANHLINYDLPWNPMKVEQRIGRLDRIGQRRTVHIHNLVCEGTLEERVLHVLGDRIRMFEESVGALDPILGSIEKDIERLALLDEPGDTGGRFSLYSDDLEKRVKQARAMEKRLADFVLDRASFRRDQLDELLDRSRLADQDDVADFCRQVLEREGGFLSEHVEGGEAVALSPRSVGRIGLSRAHYRGVFRTEEALRYDELDFFAFGHELVDRLVAYGSDLVNADVGARRSKDVPPGLWVEVVYETRVRGVRPTGRLVRHLVGPDLEVRSSELRSIPADEPLDVEVPSWVAEAVRRSQELFDVEYAEDRAEHARHFEGMRAEQIAAELRLYAYRRDRLEYQVAQSRLWLEERESGPVSESDRRVLPARKGRLAKDLERLELIRDQHEVAVEALRQQQPSMEAAVAWAALVQSA
jgi:superfamily II DNA or RNA helicase